MSIPNLGGEKWALVTFKRETKSKNYFISNLGRAKSVDKVSGEEKLMKTHPDHRGHFCLPDTDEHIHVIHKDLNRKNNHESNIIWVTDLEWKAYIKERAKKFGFKKSNKGGYYKLTAAQVAIIKKQLLNGKTRRKMIAKRFGVSTTQLKRIERGENWKHVEPAK